MKKILSLILAAAALIAAFSAAASVSAGSVFADVEEDRWSAEAINYVYEKGFMIGTGDGLFSPDSAVTRAEAVAVVYRLASSPGQTAPSPFRDVETDAWYADAVAWAYEEGIVLGRSDSVFDPLGTVTREELAAMFFRYSALCAVSVPEREDVSVFSDAENAESWAVEPLGWAVAAGLIEGVDDSTLDPDGLATREQFAAIAERFDETFTLAYNTPVLRSHYTKPIYPLVDDADFYVSATGSDENDGTFDHPFATWNRAVLAVRELKAAKDGDITVAFMAGEYGPLSVSLTAEDSGSAAQRITYCAYGDGPVEFNDGVDVLSEEFRPITAEESAIFQQKAAGNIYVADVSGRIEGYDVLTLVFSDSGEMDVARFPDKYLDRTDHLLRAAETTSIKTMRITNTMVSRRISKYHTLEGLKIYGFLTFGWYKETLSVSDYDPATGEFTVPDYYLARSADFTGGLRWEIDGEGNVFFKDDVDLALLNMSEELDAQREFWIDTENAKMYVYGEPENYHFVAGGDVMVRMSDVNCVTLRGMDFVNSDNAMLLAGGEGITVEGCTFSGCGAVEAVHISIPENANGGGVALPTVVRGCEFTNSAGNGLFIDGARRGTNILKHRSNVTVDNCSFTECNIREANTGALRLLVSGATVTHNYIGNTSWEGIDYRGTSFMTAKYNVFENVCYNGDDTGAVNSYDGEEAKRNVISNNLFLSGTAGIVGRYCAYLDNSSGTEFCNNLIYNCGIAVMSNGDRGNDIHHNVIINTDGSPAEVTIKDEGTVATLAAGASGDFSAVISNDNYKRWKKFLDLLASDPNWNEAAAENVPELLDLTTDISRWAEPEFILNIVANACHNRMISKTGKGLSFSEAIELYCDVSDNLPYTLSENPLFVNPTVGDYRLRDGVDFPDLEFENIGRY